MNVILKRLLATVSITCLAAMCFAPFRDMRSNVKIEPEKSEAQRQLDQREHQLVQGEAVPPPIDTEPDYGPAIETDAEGAANIVEAERQSEESQEEKNSKAALIEAERDIKARERGGFNWIWAALFGALGLGVVIAIRQYAAKTIPDMPERKNARW